MRWLCVLALVLGVGCKKGDPQKCDKACRNYAELVFWKGADAEIAAAPVEKREELRKQKLAEFNKNLERGIDLCTTKCVDANYSKDVDCWLAAKTAEQAKACGDD